MPEKKYKYVRKTFTFDEKKYEVYGATEEDAIRKKYEKLRQLEEGRISNNSTVRQWSAIWLSTYVKPRDITPKSLKMYEDQLDNIILPAIGSTKLRKVTDVQLQSLINSRSKMSASSVAKLRMVLKAMFKQAVQSRLISYDPAAGLTLPKTRKGSRRSITDAERAALLAVADYPTFSGYKNRSGLWILCILYCGLRPGETAALRWEDIDLESATLHVRHAKESGSNIIKEPKTAAGLRSIPIPSVYLDRLKAEAKKAGYVFTQKDGVTPLTEESMKRRWETIKKHMDIAMGATVETIKPKGKRKRVQIIKESVVADDLDLYCLRHTYCTDLQKKGVPLNIAKYLMGHADISTTANIYTHADSETIEAARVLINS